MSGDAAGPIDPTPLPETGTGAYILARWTSISAEEAQILYDGLAERQPSLISSKAALAQLGALAWITDLRLRLIMALCQAAMDAGELAHYCQAIVGRERAKGRPDNDLGEIQELIGVPGVPQAVLDAARGLIPTEMFSVLGAFSEAIGYIEETDGIRRTVIGTAFLVRPDVAITSAHVAFKAQRLDSKIVTVPPPLDIRVWFPRTAAGPQDAGLVSSNPVLAHSEAHMIDLDKLDRRVNAAAGTRLDFALLRLDRAIDRVKPIPLDGKNVVANGHYHFLIGFPGAKASVWDANKITRIEPAASRLIHTINSVGGMSGSCLIDDTGVPVAIHEGSIPLVNADGTPKTPPQVENRAVMLKAISTDLEQRVPGLLAALDRPAALVMYEEALVTRLGRRGAQFLADPASQADWEKLVAAVTKPGPSGPWTAHPWFTDRARTRIEKWFADAAGTVETKSRVAFVNGPRGSGKTFMIDVLKRIVPNAATDLIRLAWSEGDTTLDTLARRLEGLPGVSGTRTADGHQRYENVPAIVTALEGFGVAGAAATRKRPLFIAIDAGDGTGSITEPQTWIDLVVELSRRSWARVVLCGFPEDLLEKVEDAVPLEVACQPFAIGYVRSAAIAGFLERFGMPAETARTSQPAALAEAAKTAKAAAAAFDAPDMAHRECPELTTIMAALFAIGWHRGILPVRPEGS
ncbi:serine protease [Mesorhizobium sp.]|uniref:trypsin-like serine peptidase n=1 Tax=Mesorhizobium sp. TaxID=1871066 RepID=UPI00121EDB54|nr:serine protease [Mesorhizobium sp.]TIV60817.1 MAG: trypsin-like peptidase domain-containing protein [Mesorhizobium sp.]